MLNMLLRGLIVLWGALFALVGLQGLFGSAPYFEMFGITGNATAINTVRADLSAFFLVAAGGALLGGVRPDLARVLLVPAALFGTALIGRAIGLALGDPANDDIVRAMVVEGVSVALMLLAMRQFKTSSAA